MFNVCGWRGNKAARALEVEWQRRQGAVFAETEVFLTELAKLWRRPELSPEELTETERSARTFLGVSRCCNCGIELDVQNSEQR